VEGDDAVGSDYGGEASPCVPGVEPGCDRNLRGLRKTAAARLLAVATAAMEATMPGAANMVYPTESDAWKQDAIAGLGEPRAASAAQAREDRRRAKELEEQLHRKDQVLAETAALLVLSKSSQRSFTTARTHDLPARPPDSNPRHRASPLERRRAGTSLCSGWHRCLTLRSPGNGIIGGAKGTLSNPSPADACTATERAAD
jgi:hypothetical protein